MMNDARDPFVITRPKVFLYGTCVVGVLALLIWLYVPDAPRDTALSSPLQGPGSQSATLEDPGALQGAAASGAAAEGPAALRAASAEPAALYERYCTQCHGPDGLGKTMMARMMDGGVPSIVQGPFKVERTTDAIAALLRQGSANKRMPGFERELGEAGSRALADYVLAFPETKKVPEPK